MLEKDLGKQIDKYLKSVGEVFSFHPHGGGVQRKGLPDRLLCYKGRFVGLEIKLPGRENTLTRLQSVTLQKIRDAGGVGEMVTSVSQVRDILREMERGVR